MAKLVGGIATSHIPAIGLAIANGLQQDAYWKPFFDGFPPVREWLARVKPDVAIVIYNDHGLNFFLDKMPTFAIGAATEYRNADEGWGLKALAPFPGDPRMSWHLIEELVAADFDLTTCQEILVDHGFTVPMSLLWQDVVPRAVRVVPLAINTVQHPLPSPRRCYNLGVALGKAIESYPADTRVVVVGTGGLSHQLDGERAGFINREFDLRCLDDIVNRPDELLNLSILDLVEQAGSQGAEFILWLVMRGALSGHPVRQITRNYHIPVSNTGAGLLLLESAS
jgi:protocatechuate 4,5-dioxygenase beta chain